MKTIVTAIVCMLVLVPMSYAVSETQESRTLAQRVHKLEQRLNENTRRDRIVQNVLYMKDTGMYPQFLSMKIKINECLESKRGDDGVIHIVTNEFCAGVFGIQAR